MCALFKKRQNIFIKLIHDQASLTLAGLDALKAYMEGQDGAAAKELIAKRAFSPRVALGVTAVAEFC